MEAFAEWCDVTGHVFPVRSARYFAELYQEFLPARRNPMTQSSEHAHDETCG